jgi:hypothetical protein
MTTEFIVQLVENAIVAEAIGVTFGFDVLKEILNRPRTNAFERETAKLLDAKNSLGAIAEREAQERKDKRQDAQIEASFKNIDNLEA